MRVVFAGGGTGGHIFPGIAVARKLESLAERFEFEFWGAGGPVETDILKREGVSHLTLPSAPLPRSALAAPSFAFAVASGYLKARKLLARRCVDAVVGLGGYSSFAPVIAAAHRGMPTLLLEQNVVVGRANARLARRVDAVCLTWEDSLSRLPPGAAGVVTGNPLRRQVVEAAGRADYDGSGSILILGGSSGAVGLNSIVLESLGEIAGFGRGIIHQCGKADLERVREAYGRAGVAARVVGFLEDVESAYASAGLVVARAGGTTLSELALFGVPAILVPYPHHKDKHQFANADIFARAGAAGIIEENAGAAPALVAMMRKMFSDAGVLARMRTASLSLGRPDAAETVAQKLLELTSRRGSRGLPG